MASLFSADIDVVRARPSDSFNRALERAAQLEETHEQMALDAVESCAPAIVERVAEDCVRAAVDAELARRGELAPTLHIHMRDRDPIVMPAGSCHKALPEVLRIIQAGNLPLLVGPMGCGKTELARSVAQALGRSHSLTSLSGATSERAFAGMYVINEAGGMQWVDGAFAQAYRDGEVHLLDELDGCDSNVLLALNAPLANGHMPIACRGAIARHPDFVCIGAANTYGSGPTAQYCGRNKLDGASLDRWITVYIDYDVDLERRIVAGIAGSAGDALLSWCASVREAITKHRMQREFSTRKLAQYARQIALSGSTLADCIRWHTAGWSKDELAKVGAS